MTSFQQRVAQIFDEVVRTLKDKADAYAEALREAAAQAFPAPAVVPVDHRQRPRANSSRRK
jgi:hypothetical protein